MKVLLLLVASCSVSCFSSSPQFRPPSRRSINQLRVATTVLASASEASSVEAFDALLLQMVAESSDEREQRMRDTVSGWSAELLQQNADALSKAIETRVVSVQTAAIAEHNLGNDTTVAQAELQALVDMMVYSKILIRARVIEQE